MRAPAITSGEKYIGGTYIRNATQATVITMVADLIQEGTIDYRIEWVGEDVHRQVKEVTQGLGTEFLRPIKDALPPEITYDQIRLVVAYLKRTGAPPK